MTIRPDRASWCSQIGLRGELLVAYLLESHGIQVAHVDRAEIDLWVRTASGRMATVQVKTCTEPRRDRQRPPRYRFGRCAGTTADYVALVALDRQIVIIYPSSHPCGGVYQPDSFTREAQEASIAEHLANEPDPPAEADPVE